ncbi:MAG: hypothetical protein PHC40_04940 [Eubacteriales bacterium]|nr:hypothetical protein [Eubacteriales bacterium]
MKVFIISLALILTLTGFFVFQVDCGQYIQISERAKETANDAADAAGLFYSIDQFAGGYKVFDKDDGNAAILEILRSNLNLNTEMKFSFRKVPDVCHWKAYYIDDTGAFSEYQDGILIQEKTVDFPFLLVEPLTNYSATLSQASVIVTIDCGYIDFMVPFVENPHLIRSSAFEYAER